MLNLLRGVWIVIVLLFDNTCVIRNIDFAVELKVAVPWFGKSLYWTSYFFDTRIYIHNIMGDVKFPIRAQGLAYSHGSFL